MYKPDMKLSLFVCRYKKKSTGKVGHVVRIDVCHSPVNMILNLYNMACVSLVYPKMTGN